jgi:predicted amidophosphoribosyltransferase
MRQPAAQPSLARRLAAALAPPRCPACRRLADNAGPGALCARCERLILAATPAPAPIAGIEGPLALTRYEGPGRALVAALKRAHLRAVTEAAAELILQRYAGALAGRPLVAVPAAPLRAQQRGFDPAEELARALARPLGAEVLPLLRRRGFAAQKRRSRRRRRLAPPRIEATEPAPAAVVLVDDVVTTGATLAAAGAALHAAGCRSVRAVAFAATPPPRGSLAGRGGGIRMGARIKRGEESP